MSVTSRERRSVAVASFLYALAFTLLYPTLPFFARSLGTAQHEPANTQFTSAWVSTGISVRSYPLLQKKTPTLAYSVRERALGGLC